MAEYSTNYTQNTTDIALGTETYKFSRVVSTVNPSTMDNSCIYCGSETPVKYDYYPCYMYTGDKLTLMNSKWNVASNKFKFTNSMKDSNFNISFALCDYNSTTENSGINSVYQIGKTIYNEASSSSASNIRILNPTDIRKFLFRPQFDGYLGTSNSLTGNVDIKYLMDHPDDFYVTAIRMKSIFWNGSNYTSTSTRLERIRPCIIGDDYFLPLTTCLVQHAFQTTDYNTQKSYTRAFYGAYDSDGMGIDFFPIESDEEITFTQEPTTTNVITDNGNKYHSSYNSYLTDYNLFSPAKQVLKLLAYCGCYFVDNSYSTSGKTLNTFWNDEHIYLGEMKEGARTTGVFIKGTDLLTSNTINKGEYSSQTDFNPSPSPSGDDDRYADMGIGVGTGVGGYTTFAIMTISDLVDLLADFNANLETGMSVVNNFICLFKLGPLASSLCSTRVGNIIMSANATDNFVSIRADYNIVTNQKDVITLGSYNVPRMTNTFYDFAPYSTYELFIPCCGWVPLPDTVAGRTIDVYMIIDLSSCTCKGICRIAGTTVAEVSGVLGVSVPFFSTDSGIKRAADLIAVTQVIGGVAQGAVGANSGSGALVVSGTMNAVQGLEQLYINSNTNYTAIKGGNGDITAVGNGEYCTIKITHPKVDEVVNNSRFGHSVGYLCNIVGKIKDFKGLTVCANPHVNGIDCTDSEKEEIKRLLEEGIIVN